MAAGVSHSQPLTTRRRGLEISLWLFIGAMMGALIFGLVKQRQDAQRIKQVQTNLADVYSRLMPRVEAQLEEVIQLQRELEGDLLAANLAAASADLKPTGYRAKLNQIKNRVEQTDQILRNLGEENARAAAVIRPAEGSSMVPEEQGKGLTILQSRLQECRQELARIENQVNWASMRWYQLAAAEAEAARKAQEKSVEAAARQTQPGKAKGESTKRADFTSLVLLSALERSQAETERARTETLRQVTLDTLRAVQPTVTIQQPAPVAPVALLPASPYVYGGSYGAGCYTGPYTAGARYHDDGRDYRRWPSYYGNYYFPGTHPRWPGIYAIGCNPPNYQRFGPYLVINN
jgi:hypothetical protein